MSYSIQQLKQIALNNPQELIKIISNNYGSDTKTIALAIDLLGEEVTDEALVLPVIRRCLKHVHVLIRESAIMCTSSFYTGKTTPQDVIDRLKIIAKNDPSTDLRELATDTVSSLNV
jgi:hypothetical protein